MKSNSRSIEAGHAHQPLAERIESQQFGLHVAEALGQRVQMRSRRRGASARWPERSLVSNSAWRCTYCGSRRSSGRVQVRCDLVRHRADQHRQHDQDQAKRQRQQLRRS
ncbi:MAG: hypothetical protein MZV65_34430 [Chromatiales bacterium]|nr:hypothetical protein [Chromatiales bacterium]